MIGHMFEELAQGDDLSHVDDAALVDAITGWTRAEATVASHRMAAIAELTDRRGASEQAVERQFWACDAWDSAAAEIAAASGDQRPGGLQSDASRVGACAYRLPEIAKLMAEGTLAARLAHTISWRTELIEDPDVLAQVEATWPRCRLVRFDVGAQARGRHRRRDRGARPRGGAPLSDRRQGV